MFCINCIVVERSGDFVFSSFDKSFKNNSFAGIIHEGDKEVSPSCVIRLRVDVSVCCILLDELTAWAYIVSHKH